MTHPETKSITRKKLVPREKHVEASCDSLMRQMGWDVVRFSQPRNTMQTAGIPDRKYYHLGRRRTIWFECKRPGGEQSRAQRDFQMMAEECGERTSSAELMSCARS